MDPDSGTHYSYSNPHYSYSNSQMSGEGNSSRVDGGTPSYALEEYLRAEPTISERCSGAVADDQGKKKTKGKHHEKKAKEELGKFDAAWDKASKQ
ncbi:hypothetical protein F4809DRAFT_133964 [Biscogniauxia mediterranea]|nr:hypothetical protein F4809DRAFT_133964 [Biscogniauxia mediterranea]